MSRTMSGIPTSGGAGDVTLAGNPNAFTGTNTYDVNRPTSSLTNTPAANEFITKQNAENEFAILGGGTAGSPQEFFGFTNFEENVGINGQNLNLTNGINRVINMATTPALTSNKVLMEAPTTEITMTSGGSKNQFSQTATSSAINTFLQTGTASTINLISQVGVNSTITTDGKFTTATVPSGVNDLCNKTYVDGFNDVGFEGNFSANPVVSYSVGTGNPTTSSGGDNLNGRMDTPQGFLNADITIPATGGAVKIDFCVCGEWSNISWDKGLILARAEADPDGTFPNPVVYQALIRANLDPGTPANGRILVPFVQSYGAGQDYGSTQEQAVGFAIDFGTGVVIGKTYRYTPVLINTYQVATFKLNRTINTNNYASEERSTSSIVATILKD